MKPIAITVFALSCGSPGTPTDSGVTDSSVDAATDAARDAALDAMPDVLPDVMPPMATCTATVSLRRDGGTATAIWACPAGGYALWTLVITDGPGGPVLFERTTGGGCGSLASLSFDYSARTPVVAVNELAFDGGVVACQGGGG